MKKLLMLAILLSCTGAMARGKLSLQNNLYNDGKTYRPTLSFGVYEPFLKGVAVNAWAGIGAVPDDDVDKAHWGSDTQWLVAKLQLDFQGSHSLEGWTFSPGVSTKKLLNEDFQDNVGYLKVDYQLW